jgi:hypothetical protein
MSRFQPRMCPLRLGRHFQTRWRQRATKFLRPGVGALRSCAVNRASNTRKPASLENSCGRARTEFSRPGALRGLCGLHSLVDPPRRGALSLVLNSRPEEGCSLVARVKTIKGPFIPNTMEAAHRNSAWALLALVRSKSRSTNAKAASLENSCGPACSQPARAHCDWGVILFQTRWRQRYTAPPARRGAPLLSCAAKSGVQHEEARPSMARRVLSPHAPTLRLGIIYFQTRWRYSATQKFLQLAGGAR